jgi:hypothetical protein
MKEIEGKDNKKVVQMWNQICISHCMYIYISIYIYVYIYV